jgi:hypothetical protein
MDAIELLKRQHREVEAFFHEYRMLGSESPKSKEAIFEMIADALALHAEIEEKIFYPAARFRKTEKMLKHSVEEHLTVKKQLAAIMDLDAADAAYDQKVSELERDVQHHVQEEETELFRLVRTQLGRIRLEQLGTEMEAMARQTEAEGEPREAIPAEAEQPPAEI